MDTIAAPKSWPAALRDAGMEVIYTGLHQTPEMIATAAIQEDVDVIGLSILSGAHMTLIPRVQELVQAQGRDDILITGGGIIPKEECGRSRAARNRPVVRAGHAHNGIDRIHQGVVRHARKAGSVVSNRLRALSDEVKKLETKLREAGGAKRLEKLHQQGKLSARERVELLRDPDSSMLEIGLLVAYDQYEGQAPAAGVVTAIVRVHGRETVVVANDATVKAGSWWPETIRKILRAQEIAMRCRIPIVYLVDSAGVNLPYQEGVFPGQYGAAASSTTTRSCGATSTSRRSRR